MKKPRKKDKIKKPIRRKVIKKPKPVKKKKKNLYQPAWNEPDVSN